MKKGIMTIIFASAVFFPLSTALALSSEIYVTKNGDAIINGAKVIQIAGTTLFARLYWGDAFIRFTIKSNSKTKYYRGTGELTTSSEINPGDIVDLTGNLEPGSDSLILVASTVKNSSVMREQQKTSGQVTKVDPGSGIITLKSSNLGSVNLIISTSTSIQKGNRILQISNIHIGDKVTSAKGDYDYKTKEMKASSVVIYVDMKQFKPQTYVTKIKEVNNSSNPANLVVRINAKDYKVYLGVNTKILNSKSASTSLGRFEVGDDVRVYGALRESDYLEIDAEVVRNISL